MATISTLNQQGLNSTSNLRDSSQEPATGTWGNRIVRVVLARISFLAGVGAIATFFLGIYPAAITLGAVCVLSGAYAIFGGNKNTRHASESGEQQQTTQSFYGGYSRSSEPGNKTDDYECNTKIFGPKYTIKKAQYDAGFCIDHLKSALSKSNWSMFHNCPYDSLNQQLIELENRVNSVDSSDYNRDYAEIEMKGCLRLVDCFYERVVSYDKSSSGLQDMKKGRQHLEECQKALQVVRQKCPGILDN